MTYQLKGVLRVEMQEIQQVEIVCRSLCLRYYWKVRVISMREAEIRRWCLCEVWVWGSGGRTHRSPYTMVPGLQIRSPGRSTTPSCCLPPPRIPVTFLHTYNDQFGRVIYIIYTYNKVNRMRNLDKLFQCA